MPTPTQFTPPEPPPVKKIVLTGGPCAGKTSAIPKLAERFAGLGWDVKAVPEA